MCYFSNRMWIVTMNENVKNYEIFVYGWDVCLDDFLYEFMKDVAGVHDLFEDLKP